MALKRQFAQLHASASGQKMQHGARALSRKAGHIFREPIEGKTLMTHDGGTNLIRLALTATAAALLIACGGGGGGGTAGDEGDSAAVVSTGVFLDSAVEGLRFSTASQEGTTDADGVFRYVPGEMVKFFVGDILLGETEGAGVITPIDLVPGAANELHPFVTNIARFLQTLDDDADLSNGIQITPVAAALAAGKSANFEQSVLNFANDGAIQILVSELTSATSAGARALVSAADAQSHLNASLVGLLEGTWVGTTVYEATTAPYTGDQCEWRIEGQISNTGMFSFTSTLQRATGIGAGFCISSTGAGQWHRSGNDVDFIITESSGYLIGSITRHTGEISENRRKMTVSGQGVDQGVAFTVSINVSK